MFLSLINKFINRSTLMLSVALLAGLIAAWSAKQYISERVNLIEEQSRQPQASRIVAAENLIAGTVLNSAHLALRDFPRALVASDSLSASQLNLIEGATLKTDLMAGDLVLPAHVQKYQKSAFSSQLAYGRRAITMPVDAINSVSGLLKPGDLIDLYVSFEYQKRRITAPLMQGVLVLATGSETGQNIKEFLSEHNSDYSASYSTVTLDTAPQDAVKLVAARNHGTITSVLRNPKDKSRDAKASRGDLATLLGLNIQPPPIQRRATVLYGNNNIRTVPKLSTTPSNNKQPTGIFELPNMPDIVSEWLNEQQTQTTEKDLNDIFSREHFVQEHSYNLSTEQEIN